MGRADFLRLGDYNATCYQCGFKRKASQMEKNWQGYYVCPEHNEPRQTQDFVRGIPDHQTVPWAQPMPATVYTYTNAVIGIGDGVTSTFQFGSGLVNTAVTYNVTTVYLNGIPLTSFFSFLIDFNGVITIYRQPADTIYIPIRGMIISATGTETTS